MNPKGRCDRRHEKIPFRGSLLPNTFRVTKSKGDERGGRRDVHSKGGEEKRAQEVDVKTRRMETT
jgi:hypothetical protein